MTIQKKSYLRHLSIPVLNNHSVGLLTSYVPDRDLGLMRYFMQTFTIVGRLDGDSKGLAMAVSSSTKDSAICKVKRDFPDLHVQVVMNGCCLPQNARWLTK